MNQNTYDAKDFQTATATRIVNLFKSGQNRVLLADEVGLGKTIVAREVIEQACQWHKEQGDPQFRVVYICSNENIVQQNIRKLRSPDDKQGSSNDNFFHVSNWRLPMLHLNLNFLTYDSNDKKRYKIIIPLTPQTSFKINQGCGNLRERALFYLILRNKKAWPKPFRRFTSAKLEDIFLMQRASQDSWEWYKDWMDDCINKANDKSKEKANQESMNETNQNSAGYLETMYQKLSEAIEKALQPPEDNDGEDRHKQYETFRSLLYYFNTGKGLNKDLYKKTVQAFRKIFAQISVDMLEADLIIMDEFHRFNDLIDDPQKSEISALFHKLLQAENKFHTSVLLLSATPYKPYISNEELNSGDINSNLEEFQKLIQFLLDKDNNPQEYESFMDIWNKHSAALQAYSKNPTDEAFQRALDTKKNAETALQNIICRTERRNDEQIVSTAMVKAVGITPSDINSWLNTNKIIDGIPDFNSSLSTDYVNYAPYLLSFMGNNYVFSESVSDYYLKHKDKLPEDDTSFIDGQCINDYEPIPSNNARLQTLLDTAIVNNSELLLWIPPCRPYYTTAGDQYPVGDVFTKNAGFSKLLLFSNRRLVPEMTAALLSYEAERKLYSVFNESRASNHQIKYFSKNKKLSPRLRPKYRELLIYPSTYLAELDILKKSPDISLHDLYSQIRDDIQAYLKEKQYLTDEKGPKTGTPQTYLSILNLLDGNSERGDLMLPEDTADVLAWLAIASPAVCALRTLKHYWDNDDFTQLFPDNDEEDEDDEDEEGENGEDEESKEYKESKNNDNDSNEDDEVSSEEAEADDNVIEWNNYILGTAVGISSAIVSMFNREDSQTTIDIVYGKDDKTPYYLQVVKYCAEGNLQAVLDEFAFQCQTLPDFYSHFARIERRKNVEQDDNSQEEIPTVAKLAPNQSLRPALAPIGSVQTDTRESFLHLQGEKPVSIRLGYALAYLQTRTEDGAVLRAQAVRNAFNSPFRPFVLSTTSIGQEGLDFHSYCRKIVHWNLPSNPIDLEQREGRINRYMSLAIRQSLANSSYADGVSIKNFWEELIDKVNVQVNRENGDMVPYWILPKGMDCKFPIERIVPMYPFSKVQEKYDWIIKVLSLYRLTLGQPNQEGIIKSLGASNVPDEKLKELFFNLSPWSYAPHASSIPSGEPGSTPGNDSTPGN